MQIHNKFHFQPLSVPIYELQIKVPEIFCSRPRSILGFIFTPAPALIFVCPGFCPTYNIINRFHIFLFYHELFVIHGLSPIKGLVKFEELAKRLQKHPELLKYQVVGCV